MSMTARYLCFILLPLLILAGISPVQSQDLPSIPPAFLDSVSKDNAGLADLMKTDILKRLVEAQKEQGSPGQRIKRPRPEVSRRHFEYDPVDLSKYMGTDGDPQKAYEKLQELGKVPKTGIPEPIDAPLPFSATKEEKLWKDVPFKKRLDYVNDLLERREFKDGLNEIDKILNTELEQEQKIDSLIMREKLLLKDRRFDIVEKDYFRLKSYFPDEEKIDGLKEYIEKESGLQPLIEAVKNAPTNPSNQRILLDQYLKHKWLDFAEEFFADTIEDTSKPTIESLSEIYYRKKDYPMLVKLSSTAQDVHPNDPVFLYNEAVGILNEQNPGAKTKALDILKKARRLARDKSMQSRIDWYLERLQSKGR